MNTKEIPMNVDLFHRSQTGDLTTSETLKAEMAGKVFKIIFYTPCCGTFGNSSQLRNGTSLG
jgi:hypothetical protein